MDNIEKDFKQVDFHGILYRTKSSKIRRDVVGDRERYKDVIAVSVAGLSIRSINNFLTRWTGS